MKYWARDGQDGWWQSKLKRALQAEEKLRPKVQSPESEWCVLERHWGWQLAGVRDKCKFSVALVSHTTRWEWQQMKQEVGIRVRSWRALCIMLSKLDFILEVMGNHWSFLSPRKAWAGVRFRSITHFPDSPLLDQLCLLNSLSQIRQIQFQVFFWLWWEFSSVSTDGTEMAFCGFWAITGSHDGSFTHLATLL